MSNKAKKILERFEKRDDKVTELKHLMELKERLNGRHIDGVCFDYKGDYFFESWMPGAVKDIVTEARKVVNKHINKITSELTKESAQ